MRRTLELSSADRVILPVRRPVPREAPPHPATLGAIVVLAAAIGIALLGALVTWQLGAAVTAAVLLVGVGVMGGLLVAVLARAAAEREDAAWGDATDELVERGA